MPPAAPFINITPDTDEKVLVLQADPRALP